MKIRFPLLMLALAAPSLAEEGGAGHYVPGSMATLIDVPPSKAGWIVESMYLHYEGDASVSRSFPVAGLLTANLSAESDAFLLGGLHTFEASMLGGSFISVGGFVPYVWMDVSADVGPVRRDDSADGIGDLSLIPFMVAKKQGEWQYSGALTVYAPTGDYDAGRLANPGMNHWTFDPSLGVSYANADGLNFSLNGGITINTENNDTDYKSGSVLHLESSLQKLTAVGPGMLGFGVNAFFYQQISGDSGRGATLGDFKGRTVGIGPAISYILPIDTTALVMEIRWLPELETEKRLDGDYIWAKAVYQF